MPSLGALTKITSATESGLGFLEINEGLYEIYVRELRAQIHWLGYD